MNTQTYEIEITKKCNMKCSYCYLGNVTNEYNMDLNIAKYIVSIIEGEINDSVNVIYILFWGGEPFLNLEIIKYFIDQFSRIHDSTGIVFKYKIMTNGTLCNKEIIIFINSNNIHLQVSLDGDRHDHDSCRVMKNGDGTFDKVESNLHRFINSRKSLKDKQITIYASISNKHKNIANTIFFLNSFNVPFFISPIISIDEWKIGNLLSAKEVENIFKPIIDIFEQEVNNGFLNIKNMDIMNFLKNIFNTKKIINTCNAGLQWFCFGVDGHIYLCHRFINKPCYSIGRISPFSVNRDVVNRQNVTINKKKRCDSCPLKYLCSGICPYDTVCKGDISYIDPVICSFSKLMHYNIIRILKDLYIYRRDKYESLVDNFSKVEFYNKDMMKKYPFKQLSVSLEMKNNINSSLVLIKSKQFGCVDLDNEGLIFLTSKEERKYIANSTTMAVLDLIDGNRTAQQIAQEIANVCEVEFEAIKDDIYGQLAAFQELGLVEEVPAASHA